MHPDVTSEEEGKCSRCGMELRIKGKELSIKDNSVESGLGNDYTPLFVIIGLIFLTTLTLSYKDLQSGTFSLEKSISYFMIGFFLVFAGFKLINLKGFAEGYSTYDLLAQRWFDWGYVYPFIELGFGLSMILTNNPLLLWAEILVMTFSGLGVAIKLAKWEKFQCVCLGTVLKVPLTKVTLIEDFGMAVLAAVMLSLRGAP